MDGTLLNTKGEVSAEFFQLYKQLKNLGVHFVAASGRQYFSMIDKLEPIKNDIIIIAENGGIAKRQEEELLTQTLPIAHVHELIKKLRKIDDAYIVLCGKKQAYVESKREDFLNYFSEYYLAYEQVEDLLQVTDDEFLKIAVYSFNGSEETTYPHFQKVENDIKVKVSGKNWLDLSHTDAHKGNALGIVQKILHISEDETMVFGDYNNDLEMMSMGHFSYAMKNAHPNVIENARYMTEDNDNLGVERILRELVAKKTEALAANGG